MKPRPMLLIFAASLLLIATTQPVPASWVLDGNAIAPYLAPNPGAPHIVSDGAGGSLIFWEDERNGETDIYAQRTDASGTSLWTIGGTAISLAPGYQHALRVLSDGSGGAIVSWRDERNGNSDIYAQRIDGTGTVLWTVDGLAICTDTASQRSQDLSSDGAGGAIITWRDSRSNSDIYAQRVDAAGTTRWTANGVAVCADPGFQDNPFLTSDGSGGAIVTWIDNRNLNADIYAQRIDALGTAQWTADGEPVCLEAGTQSDHRVASDGAGGAIVTWRAGPFGNFDILAQRINASGAIQWIAAGEALCSAADSQYGPLITSDGAGGAIVSWTDRRNGSNYDIYAQRVDSLGTVQWTADGEPIAAGIGDQMNPHMVSDGAGGALVTWPDTRLGNPFIYAQRVNSLGTALWDANGTLLVVGDIASDYPKIAVDGAGGAIATWWQSGSSDWGIFAQRVDDTGARQWSLRGAAICATEVVQSDADVAPDGASGSLVAWVDTRRDLDDIFVQRVDATGTARWTANGVLVSPELVDKSEPQITSDDAGGAIVTWHDARYGQSDVFAQRINATGSIQWAAGGVLLSATVLSHEKPQIVGDGAGGAIVAWQGLGALDIHAQRVGASGVVQWTAGGVPICTDSGNEFNPQIISDGAGGAILSWADTRSGDYDVYAQRINASGAVQWTANGIAVSAASAGQSQHQLVPDGLGGAIVAWQDGRGSDSDIYVQRINASGAAQWTSDGVLLCAALGDQYAPQLAPDGSNGAIVTWEDLRSGEYDVYAGHVDAGGAVGWLTDGVPLCTAALGQSHLQIAADGTGGAIVSWQDGRIANDFDIYAQRVNAIGAVQWSPDGEALCTETGSQSVPQMATDGMGGAFVSWQDLRSGETRVYIQKTTDLGLGAICDVSPDAISFPGSIETGSYADTTFTITNVGFGTLVGHIQESCDSYTIVSGGGSFALGNGGSRVVTVRFEPTTAGSYPCTIETGTYLCSDMTITANAHACPPGSLLYVDADATGNNDGSSWTDAYAELYDAMAAVELCAGVSEIWVAEGIYRPTAGMDRDVSFQLRDGLIIYGGFAGTETVRGERDHFANVTILSGDLGLIGDPVDNSHTIVTSDNNDDTAVLEGFTITAANWSSGIADGGGGMLVFDSSPTLDNLLFENNACASQGGGMHITGESYPTLTNTFFCDNTAYDGAGIFIGSGSFPVLTNLVFTGNYAQNRGGGIRLHSGDMELLNASFSDNTADASGGGLSHAFADQPDLVNVVLWGNSSPAGPDISNFETVPRVAYSLIAGCGGSGPGWNPVFGGDGGGNLDDDPMLFDAAAGDLRLRSGSPAIDTGSNWPGLLSLDILGEARIQNGTVDMGAYEGGTYAIQITVVSVPSGLGLQVMVDGQAHAEPHVFDSEEGRTHQIGVATPQLIGDQIYSFDSWNDLGDTTHTITVSNQPAHYDASFTSLAAYATINSILDVPADQGGWARLHFDRSHYDDADETQYPIARYDVHRRVDDPAKAAALLEEGLAQSGLPKAPPGVWEVVGNVTAQQQSQYIRLVPTVGDSSATIPWSVYYVSAHTTTPTVFFDSPPDSSYSVDNIAPGVPEGFIAAYYTGSGNQLSWDPCPDADFQFFRIYRGTDPQFVPGPANEVDATADVSWTDPDFDDGSVYYKITALDHAGNESPAASPGTVIGIDGVAVPKAFALYQNFPNPFNPSTVIQFDVPPGDCLVTLRVYDVAGRRIRTLVNAPLPAGRQVMRWSGTDDDGRRVASGVYFYRMTASGFVATRKLSLLE